MVLDPSALEALPPPRSKVELLNRIPPARQALEATLVGLSESQMTTPSPSGWSIKDHLAHLAAWERMLVAHLKAGNDHEVAGLDKETYATAALDEINAAIGRRHKDRPLASVIEEFRGAHTAIVAYLETLSDADFARPYWQDDPQGRTVLDKVTGDTERHYLEHRRWIKDLLREGVGRDVSDRHGPLRVRRVRADEGLLLRSIRLQALAEAPTAFGSTLAEERARPESDWHERARAGAAGEGRATFFLEAGDHAGGMATGIFFGDEPDTADLVGVWIDPSLRGRGGGEALVEAVTEWARTRGARSLALWVTEGNLPAITVYERRGFRRTGETQPLPHTPSLSEVRMVLPLLGAKHGD